MKGFNTKKATQQIMTSKMVIYILITVFILVMLYFFMISDSAINTMIGDLFG